MEAFQLSLGRQVEPNIVALRFKNAVVARGRDLFRGDGGCDSCHTNGGANDAGWGQSPTRHGRRGTARPAAGPDASGPWHRPHARRRQQHPPARRRLWAGSGRTGATRACLADDRGFGNSEFNTASVIEAADTPPFFHDNSIETIEGAVAFYNSRSFNEAPDGRGIALEATQVEAIAAFLRVLNALDNIREATESATAAKRASDRAAADLLAQAIGDTQDAMGVLFARSLHPSAVKSLERAADAFKRASGGRIDRGQIDRGLAELDRAKGDILN